MTKINQAFEVNAPKKAKKPKHRLRKADFQKLLNRHCHYDLNFRLDIFQWMIKTSWSYRYDRTGAFEWLHNHSGTGTLETFALGGPNRFGFSSDTKGHWFSGIPRFRLTEDKLKFAFFAAICDTSCPHSVWEWREKERVKLGNYRMLPQPKESIPWRRGSTLKDLFSFAKKPLTTQLNSVRADAIEIEYILMTPNRDGWKAVLRYGVGGSLWNHDLTGRGFCSEVVREAIGKMEELTKENKGEQNNANTNNTQRA